MNLYKKAANAKHKARVISEVSRNPVRLAYAGALWLLGELMFQVAWRKELRRINRSKT